MSRRPSRITGAPPRRGLHPEMRRHSRLRQPTADGRAEPRLEQYEADLAALEILEKNAEADLARAEQHDWWEPTEYERRYLPGLRLVGFEEKDSIVLQNAADLHLHTHYSDGDRLERVLDAAMAAGLDTIAITDHDEIEGALEARRIVHERRLPLAVVPGVEVSSADGHIGALFVTRKIPAGLDAAETLRRIHAAGGLAVAHHPYVPWWIEKVLRQKLGCRDLIKSLPFDAVECTNAVPGSGTRYNRAAIDQLNQSHTKVAVTGSSDAHVARLVGKGRTFFAGNEGVVSLHSALMHGFTLGAEGYWSTGEKLAYWCNLFRALVRNTLLRRGSVN